ncbi:hypothetical protein HWI79_1883 [Cryptosporidium felis]|nr:hypothetical protein HWI79_1883 [Cryptosporidium felis]
MKYLYILFLILLFRLFQNSNSSLSPVKKSSEGWTRRGNKREHKKKPDPHKGEITPIPVPPIPEPLSSGPLLLALIVNSKTANIYYYTGNAHYKNQCDKVHKILAYSYKEKEFYAAIPKCRGELILSNKSGHLLIETSDITYDVCNEKIISRKTRKIHSKVKVDRYWIGRTHVKLDHVKNFEPFLIPENFNIYSDQIFQSPGKAGTQFKGVISQKEPQLKMPMVEYEKQIIEHFYFNSDSYLIFEGRLMSYAVPIKWNSICTIMLKESVIKCDKCKKKKFTYYVNRAHIVREGVEILTVNIFGTRIIQAKRLSEVVDLAIARLIKSEEPKSLDPPSIPSVTDQASHLSDT